mgnify:CR=1 FL=1
MMVGADGGVLLEDLGLVWLFHILFNGHQAFLAGLLQDVKEQCHQLHVTRLGVLAALEAQAQTCDGGLDDLGLVVGEKRTHCGTANGDQFKRQGMQNHHDVAAVKDVNAKHANQDDKPADDYKHSGGVRGVER